MYPKVFHYAYCHLKWHVVGHQQLIYSFKAPYFSYEVLDCIISAEM